MTDQKTSKAKASAEASVDAATRILDALAKGKAPDLADAKILEATGCYIRRAIA